ncbi:MAG TPA: hypothetical protein DCE23_03890 [Firmicutes bacterium]|nr:hypothetical protein [Bacillota bacterium]
MFSYDFFKNKINKISTEDVDNVVYASWYGNTILTIFFITFIIEILYYTLARINKTLYIITYIILLCLSILYICTRKSSLALTKNNIVCVIFKHFGYQEKEVYEIPKNKIKSLNVHKLLYLRFISISFISKKGRLEHKKIYFSNFFVGPNSKKWKEDSQIVFQELTNLQKKLDRGDF